MRRILTNSVMGKPGRTLLATVVGLSMATAGMQAAEAIFKGFSKVEYFEGITGAVPIDLLKDAPAYKNNQPTSTGYYPGIEMGVNTRNDYGARITGWLTPSKTGKYRFFLSADDAAEFWLSTDATPGNLALVATEPAWNGSRQYALPDRRPGCTDGGGKDGCENVSAEISLTAGSKYAYQGLVKEGGGGDNFAIAWAEVVGGNFTVPANGSDPINGQNIETKADDSLVALSITRQPGSITVVEGRSASMSVGVSAALVLPQYQWTFNGADVAGATGPTISVPAVTLSQNGGKVRCKVTATAGGKNFNLLSDEATLTVIKYEVGPRVAGKAVMEWYEGIGGNAISDLTGSAAFLNRQPTAVFIVDSFEKGQQGGQHEAYGGRIHGLFRPKTTGNYTFFVSADDNAALFLSTDDNPANATQIAREPEWNGFRAWATNDRRPGCGAGATPEKCENRSAPIALTAGKDYYLSVMWKEGGGGDSGAATFKIGNDADPADGDASLLTGDLIAYRTDLSGAKWEMANNTDPADVTTVEGRPANFAASLVAIPGEGTGIEDGKLVLDGGDPVAGDLLKPLQWSKGGVAIDGATKLSYRIPETTLAMNGNKFKLTATSRLQTKTATSREATLTVSPDTFAPVPTGGALAKGANVEIGVGFDEAVDATSALLPANYSIVSGGTLVSATPFTRSLDGFSDDVKGVFEIRKVNTMKLTVSGVAPGGTVKVKVAGVKDLKNNAIPASGATFDVKTDGKTWAVVGASENGFDNNAVRIGAEDFEVISSGVGFWADYDEGVLVYEEVTGDFVATARVEYQDPSTQWARTGLMMRENLDAGKVRPSRPEGCTGAVNADDTDCVPKAERFSRLQDVHVNPTTRWDNGASNNSYENHFRNDAQYKAAFGNQLDSADGGFGPIQYPNAWMRLERVGNAMSTYRSLDGVTWNKMTSGRTFNNLAAKVYVGIASFPELANNGTGEALQHGVYATFRNFTITKPTIGGGKINSVKLTGGKVVIDYTGTLQKATKVEGPYGDVSGASPLSADPVGTSFYRIKP